MAEIKIKGWKAVAVLLLLSGVGGFQYYKLQTTLDAKAAGVIKAHLESEYSGEMSQMLDQARQAKTPLNAEAIMKAAEKLQRIKISSISARAGRRNVDHGNHDEVIVRVEYTIDGKPPPDGKSPRYFVMEERLLGEWRLNWETSAFNYYSKLW
ncbi:MAG: hypothetical protein HY360_23930 [Verrucomicrobia bacterium]|nr:hypothetical protein [Verrucomicrobiota bacterium]